MRSVRSIGFGLLLLLAAAAVLFWNEGRSLRQSRALAEGEAVVKTIAVAPVDPQNEGRLVHLTGRTSAAEKLRDEELGIEAEGLKLTRTVEMFQWKEARSTRSGRGSGETEADFTYSRTWSEQPIDWTRFRFPQDHRNPPMPGIASRSFIMEGARIGAFAIDDRVIGMLGGGTPLSMPPSAAERTRERLGRPAQIMTGGIFAGDDPAEPRVGDIRIHYTLLPLQTISLAGRQSGDRIAPFRAANGNEILLAQSGSHDAVEMFDTAEGANAVTTWVVRVVGSVLVYIGWRVVLHPLRMIASYIPLVDTLAGLGVGIAAFVATLVTAPLVIGIAWLFYRPLAAAVIIAIGGGCGYLAFGYLRRGSIGRPIAPG